MAILLDPAKVSLLLHGASPIVDSSARTKTLTAGGVTSSTVASVFGGSSLLRASGTQLTTPANADFNMGTGDFAIELRVRRSGGSGRMVLIAQCDSSGSTASASFIVQINASDRFEGYCVSGSTAFASCASSASVISDTWYTVEYSRSGTTFRLRVDGVTAATATSSSAVNSSSSALGLHGLGEYTSLQFTGYIDEAVILKGGLLHSADYTPATEPYTVYSISGTVKDSSGANAARLVRAYREDLGTLVGSVTSDGGTGAYTIPVDVGTAHTLNAYPAGGETLPALTLRGVIPV